MNLPPPLSRAVAIFVSGVLFWQPLLASTQQAGQSAAAVHGEQAVYITGDGGYGIEVAGHTHLTAGIIASTDKAQASGYNRFDTGSFSQEALYNVAEYEASGFGIGAGFGVNGKEGKQGNMTPQGARNPGGSAQGSGKGSTVASADLGYGFDRDKDTSVTYSYIGTTDKRPDSGALGNNFDAAKVQKEIELQVSVTQQFSQNWRAARKDLSLAKDTLKQKLDAKQIDQAEYDKQVSTLGQITLLLDTVGAGLSAPTNNLGGILAAAASPTLAQAIGSYYKARDKEGSLGHLLAHGVLAASVAAAGGNDPLTAALAAGSAEALTPLVSKWLYGTADQSRLNADQKSTLSAIAGLAGAGIGATTGDMASTVASGQLAQNAVDNNRQLNLNELFFLHDQVRVVRFKDYYEKTHPGKKITLAEAQALLDNYGTAMLDRDWTKTHGRNATVEAFLRSEATAAAHWDKDGNCINCSLFKLAPGDYENWEINKKELMDAVRFVNVPEAWAKKSGREAIRQWMVNQQPGIFDADWNAQYNAISLAGYEDGLAAGTKLAEDTPYLEDIRLFAIAFGSLPSKAVSIAKGEAGNPLKSLLTESRDIDKIHNDWLYRLQDRPYEAGYTVAYSQPLEGRRALEALLLPAAIGTVGKIAANAANAAKAAGTAVRVEAGMAAGTNASKNPVVLELFGGKTGQVPGAINVDIIAEQGVRASATKLPFKQGSVDQIIASNPYFEGLSKASQNMMYWLPESANALKPGGQIVINGTYKNPFAKLPDVQELEKLGLRVVQDRGPLLPQFQNQSFRQIDGTVIKPESVKSTILEKVR